MYQVNTTFTSKTEHKSVDDFFEGPDGLDTCLTEKEASDSKALRKRYVAEKKAESFTYEQTAHNTVISKKIFTSEDDAHDYATDPISVNLRAKILKAGYTVVHTVVDKA